MRVHDHQRTPHAPPLFTMQGVPSVFLDELRLAFGHCDTAIAVVAVAQWVPPKREWRYWYLTHSHYSLGSGGKKESNLPRLVFTAAKTF